MNVEAEQDSNQQETAAQEKHEEGRTVEDHKKWLVQEGDRIGELAKSNRDWKHQVRTIWEAARLENEPLVVLNLLRYQAARNPGNWRQPADVYEALGTKNCPSPIAAGIPVTSPSKTRPGRAGKLILVASPTFMFSSAFCWNSATIESCSV